MIQLMFGAKRFNVYRTDLGEERVELDNLYDYDIILIDSDLPDMHGFDVPKSCVLVAYPFLF